jgi:predicted transposase YdaD
MAGKRFDASLKHLVETYPRDWAAYLRPFLGATDAGPVKAIDSDVSTVSAAVDKVLRVGGRRPWLLHLELQASHLHRLAEQLLLYNVLLQDRHHLPVRSVVLLLRPEADRPNLTGVLRQAWPEGRVYLEFHYTVVRLWEQPVEALLAGGLGLLPLAPLAGVPTEQVERVIRRMEKRIAAEAPATEVADLWTATLVLLGLNYSAEFANYVMRGVRTMKESTTYQAILAEGEAKGKAEGKVEGLRGLLLHLAGKRFGEVEPMLVGWVRTLDDLDYLTRLIERVYEAADWDDLLSTPLPQKAKGRRKKPS